MAEAKKDSAANRRRGNTSRGGSSKESGSSARRPNSRPRASARTRPTASPSVSRASLNGARTTVKDALVPVASAAVGAAAAIVVGRRAGRPRKVLGIPVPGTGRDGLGMLAKEVRKTGEQFGNLASEVKTARQKAEKVGKAVS
jgi:hypothetical protein